MLDPRILVSGTVSETTHLPETRKLIFHPHLPNEHGATLWSYTYHRVGTSTKNRKIYHTSIGRGRSRSPRRRKDDDALHYGSRRHRDRHNSREHRRHRSTERDSERRKDKDKRPEREMRSNESVETVGSILRFCVHCVYTHLPRFINLVQTCQNMKGFVCFYT